eukprot:3275739-Amphidinium_carterae.1
MDTGWSAVPTSWAGGAWCPTTGCQVYRLVSARPCGGQTVYEAALYAILLATASTWGLWGQVALLWDAARDELCK